MKRLIGFLIFLLALGGLTACHASFASLPQTTSPARIDLDARRIAPTRSVASATPTDLPPTPPPQPVTITATVWETLPEVPILMYHRFDPQPGAVSALYRTSLTDFKWHLQTLYDAGFSLIALEDWLRGNIHPPEGRRPLIITIDDLFYADQLSLDENGAPASYSGVGLLWQFSKEHSDFGFAVALFYNLGDKGYANHYGSGGFTIENGWRQARAEAIAWGIKNGATPLNHFYEHPNLSLLSPEEIHWQIEENEKVLRESLALIGEESLAANLPNILALPYVIWPETEPGKQVLFDYLAPNGAPVAAIVEGGGTAGARLFPAPFSADFDPYHVPRVNASREAIDLFLEISEGQPRAQQCELRYLSGSPQVKPGEISAAILDQVNKGICPDGYYMVDQLTFYVQQDEIMQLSP